jgi:dihydropteroate synthase
LPGNDSQRPAALLAVQRGAAVVRVHDVAETRDALQMLAGY